MIATLIAWCAARLIPLAIGAAAVTGYFAWDYVRIQKAETRGAERALVKVERQNAELKTKAGSAGRKSLDPSAGGLRNPYYRD